MPVAKGGLRCERASPMKARGHSGRRFSRLLPKGICGRILLACAACLLLVLAVAGLIAGSIWIEDRHPADDPQRALFPRAQRTVTRPIVQAVSRRIEEQIRRNMEAKFMKTGLSLEETITRFLDESIDLRERRIHAYRLAREGTPDSIAALLKVFHCSPAEDKAYMAGLIGRTGNPAARDWLKPLLSDPDETIVRAAARGLGLLGGDDVVAALALVLNDGERSQAVRIETAIALGSIGSAASTDALLNAFSDTTPDKVMEGILHGLGKAGYHEVAPVFEALIASKKAPMELRVVAVEALSESSNDAIPYLVEVASYHEEADLRASAAWAIGVHGSAGYLAPRLVDLTEREPEAEVRRRLYEAMLTQPALPADRVLSAAMKEEEPAARIAGFNAIGHAARTNPGSKEAATFDAEIIPELLRTAGQPNSLNLRMRAVFALRRADTPAARQALEILSRCDTPQISTAAQNGLRSAHP